MQFQLLDALKKAKFLYEGKDYSFDVRGDIETGYDIILWKYATPPDLEMDNIVGQYDIGRKMLTFNSNDLNIQTVSIKFFCLFFLCVVLLHSNTVLEQKFLVSMSH